MALSAFFLMIFCWPKEVGQSRMEDMPIWGTFDTCAPGTCGEMGSCLPLFVEVQVK